MRKVTLELTEDQALLAGIAVRAQAEQSGGEDGAWCELEALISAADDASAHREKRGVPGSIVSSYRETVKSIDILCRALNNMQAAGELPSDRALDSALGCVFGALKLASLHFPSLRLAGMLHVPEDPCPLCGAKQASK